MLQYLNQSIQSNLANLYSVIPNSTTKTRSNKQNNTMHSEDFTADYAQNSDLIIREMMLNC